MLSGLVKAQLVAFLTKKLVDSPIFNKSVAALHGQVSGLSEDAYTALLKATQEGDAKLPPMMKENRPQPNTTSEPVKPQNQALLSFIEKTKKELKERGG